METFKGMGIPLVLLSMLALLMATVSIATEYWNKTSSIHEGLFSGCVGSICVNLGMDVPAFLHLVRACMIIGIIGAGVGLMFDALVVAGKSNLFRQYTGLRYFAQWNILAACAFFIGTASYITFYAYLHHNGFPLGYSFYLATGAGSVSVVTSILGIIILQDIQRRAIAEGRAAVINPQNAIAGQQMAAGGTVVLQYEGYGYPPPNATGQT